MKEKRKKEKKEEKKRHYRSCREDILFIRIIIIFGNGMTLFNVIKVTRVRFSLVISQWIAPKHCSVEMDKSILTLFESIQDSMDSFSCLN